MAARFPLTTNRFPRFGLGTQSLAEAFGGGATQKTSQPTLFGPPVTQPDSFQHSFHPPAEELPIQPFAQQEITQPPPQQLVEPEAFQSRVSRLNDALVTGATQIELPELLETVRTIQEIDGPSFRSELKRELSSNAFKDSIKDLNARKAAIFKELQTAKRDAIKQRRELEKEEKTKQLKLEEEARKPLKKEQRIQKERKVTEAFRKETEAELEKAGATEPQLATFQTALGARLPGEEREKPTTLEKRQVAVKERSVGVAERKIGRLEKEDHVGKRKILTDSFISGLVNDVFKAFGDRDEDGKLLATISDEGNLLAWDRFNRVIRAVDTEEERRRIFASFISKPFRLPEGLAGQIILQRVGIQRAGILKPEQSAEEPLPLPEGVTEEQINTTMRIRPGETRKSIIQKILESRK